MPMIDVYAPEGLLLPDAEAELAQALSHAVLRAEGVTTPSPLHLDNTACFVHRLPPRAIATARATEASVVRVQIITPPGALPRAGQRAIAKEATELVQRFSSAPKVRTWVILTEAAEGGWGLEGTAFGKEEFAALAARAGVARAP